MSHFVKCSLLTKYKNIGPAAMLLKGYNSLSGRMRSPHRV